MVNSSAPMIFMSYSRKDSEVQRRLVAALRKQGLNVWVDNEKLVPGTPIWEEAIEKAIIASSAMIIILSPDAKNSVWVRREISFAEQYRKRIFPVLVRGDEDSAMTLRMINRQYVDFRQNEKAGIRSLHAALVDYFNESDQEFQAKQAAEQLAARKTDTGRESLKKTEREKRAPEAPEVVGANRRARAATVQSLRDALPKLKIPALILCLVLIGYLLWQGTAAPIPDVPTQTPVTSTQTPSATQTLFVEPGTETPAPVTNTPVIIPTSTPGIGSTMIGEDGAILVYVPEGEFSMGSENGDSDEKPVYTISLESFWIDRTEVTNKQYAVCVAAGKCDTPSQIDSTTRDSYYGYSKFYDFPVIYMNWDDAKAYCEWAGRRLPTEAEWEKAARGIDGRTYPWGEGIDCSRANYYDGSRYCVGDTSKVGSYETGKSPYGAYDMAGNVWEWASSLLQPYPYDADDGRENMSSSGSRVLRGGSWDYVGDGVRSASRVRYSPVSDNDVGFRCASDTSP